MLNICSQSWGMEQPKYWIPGIQTSRQVTLYGERLDGKNIALLRLHKISLKSSIQMFLFPTTLGFLVSCCVLLRFIIFKCFFRMCFWLNSSSFHKWGTGQKKELVMGQIRSSNSFRLLELCSSWKKHRTLHGNAVSRQGCKNITGIE